jgi:hypothetical protein
MEKFSRSNRAGNYVLHKTKDENNILYTIKRMKANWIGHILRRDCRPKQLTEGKIERGSEVMG